MTDAFGELPASWAPQLASELGKPYFDELRKFVAAERSEHSVFPPANEVFAAFEHTPYPAVRVLLVGQDPYHDDDQAHGLCFSVRRGIKLPPSLRNIYKELESDIGVKLPKHGFLQPWAERGILMLNTVLTVRAHEPNSHRKRGWETFTDRVIEVVAEREAPVVFVLWGKPAQTKLPIIESAGAGRHAIVMAAHPSPLSAKAGFFGSKCFSAIDRALVGFGQAPIDWSLPD